MFPFFSPFGLDIVPTSYSGPVLDDVEQAKMIDFLKELVRTPSTSGGEEAVAQLIADQLRSGGVKNTRVDPAGNVIATLGDGDGPTLLYDAHMDTVQSASGIWEHGPYSAAIVDDMLYGVGACDMKGAIAALVYTARQLAQDKIDLHGNLIFAFVVQEEPCEGYALKYIVEQQGIKPDWVVLGEPSNLNIMRGHRGRVLFKVTVQGKSSHAANPDLGQNAITVASRLIFGIDLLASDLPSDPSIGAGTLAVTNIESRSSSMNAIPDSCCFYVDRRLTVGETITRAQAQLERVIQHERIAATVEIFEYQVPTYTGHIFEVREAFNAWSVESQSPLIQAAETAVRASLGYIPQVGYWSFSTDGVYSMGEAGIPTIGFGPGDPRYAHTSEEHIRLGDVTRAVHVYKSLAEILLSRPAT
jgi:putative selenium metabolism hydrolase